MRPRPQHYKTIAVIRYKLCDLYPVAAACLNERKRNLQFVQSCALQGPSEEIASSLSLCSLLEKEIGHFRRGSRRRRRLCNFVGAASSALLARGLGQGGGDRLTDCLRKSPSDVRDGSSFSFIWPWHWQHFRSYTSAQRLHDDTNCTRL